MESYALLIAATLNAGTVLAIAALGLLINEKAGIVNLGAEGMMLCSAIAGFATVVHTGSDLLGFAAGMGAGALLALIFGALVIGLNTNQYATGLALSLFGVVFQPLLAPVMCKPSCPSACALRCQAWPICPWWGRPCSNSIPWSIWSSCSPWR